MQYIRVSEYHRIECIAPVISTRVIYSSFLFAKVDRTNFTSELTYTFSTATVIEQCIFSFTVATQAKLAGAILKMTMESFIGNISYPRCSRSTDKPIRVFRDSPEFSESGKIITTAERKVSRIYFF